MGGFLTIDKPRGLTSTAVTNRVRRTFVPRQRAGHAGTLDPLASGLLVVAIGEATRFIRFLDDAKGYRLEVTFGVQTDTMDAEGKVVRRAAPPGDLKGRVAEALGGFVGRIRQRAPAHSALKHEGKPLYHYARRGVEVEPKVRQVRVDSIEILDWPDDDRVELDVACGPGTYMRSLASDLGDAVGCGAHMSALARTRCCGRSVEDAVRYVEDGAVGCYESHLVATGDMLAHLPRVDLSGEQAVRIKNGMVVPYGGKDGVVTVWSGKEGGFLGVGELGDGTLSPLRMLPTQAAA